MINYNKIINSSIFFLPLGNDLYKVGELQPFEEVSSDLEEQLRELPKFSSSEEYPLFEVIGGGRIFNENLVFDEIYNQDLLNKIKQIEQYAEGGEAKKRRRRANAQIGKTNRSIDKEKPAKPVGYRFTNALASKLRKDKYEVPTEKQIKKYLGKGIYKENRRNESDRDLTAKL